MSNGRSAIRLLIADDSDETRASVRKLLSLEDDIQVIGEAQNGLEALEKVRLLRPDIVLMDVRMPELDGFGATEAIVAEMHNVQVIMMSVAGTADVLRRAMLAGAREFLLKPFEPEEMVACVRRVQDLYAVPLDDLGSSDTAQAPTTNKDRQGSVVAVFSPKGGVGCTTVACNLAVALAGQEGRRVALVDGCMRFGDVAMTLSLRQERSLADLVGIDPADVELDMVEEILNTHQSGVRVLLPPATHNAVNMITPQALCRVLSEMRKAYDYVVVDVSSALSETDMAVLAEADRVVTLFTLELTALKDVKHFLDLAKSLDYAKGKLLMVASRVDEAGGVKLADVEGNLHFQTAICIRSDPKLATLALNKGMPFVLTHKHSSLAQSIQELVVLVGKSVEEDQQAEQHTTRTRKKGRFGFLSSRQGKNAVA
jgi:pilus assembly protein CpaE